MPLLTKEGRQIYWRTDGDPGKPKLILLNSLGTEQGLWGPLMPRLLESFHVLRMDKRGHGGSTNLADSCTMADLARDVLSVMDAAGWRRAHVCGVSIGGMQAMWLGIHAPDRVDRLVLSNTSAAIPREVFAARIEQVRAEGLAAMSDTILGRFFTASFIAEAGPVFHSARENLLQVDPRGYIACCAAIRDMQLMDGLAAIKAPSLVILGEQDQSTPPVMGETIAASIPGAEAVRLPYAHIPLSEVPQEYARIVTDFLLKN
ncbi:3-oxoadipate enol-lactonase [Orrella daihaiensis]|uniref:3-oxoadipate enol-lactonase n=1 Tax=Orrella daihaiensis TaxID=2782176 RepID=A0ABY4ANZ1_9BURK|nr:3-oxoadipate enol-lactonase [Orrella daihaiensis]UOD50752.1 3-oxoadipate enol-lactonase [Orrella daihaiensis]